MMEAKPVKLNIGCGLRLVSGFINIDKTYKYEDIAAKKGFYSTAEIQPGAVYLQADVLKLPFPDDYADYIESVDMIEHLPFRETLDAVKEMRRVLKKGRALKIVTTNFDELAKLWIEQVAGKHMDFGAPNSPFYNLMEVIYGNQTSAGEFHHTPFNPRYAYALLRNAGFEDKNIEITGYPAGTPAEVPDLQTNGSLERKKGFVVRTEMLLLSAVK